MEYFSLKNAPKISTSFQMKYLANRFSKIVTNIESIEGLDQIMSEIETYSTYDEVAAIQTKNLDAFWREVSALKEGDDSWAKFPLLHLRYQQYLIQILRQSGDLVFRRTFIEIPNAI